MGSRKNEGKGGAGLAPHLWAELGERQGPSQELWEAEQAGRKRRPHHNSSECTREPSGGTDRPHLASVWGAVSARGGSCRRRDRTEPQQLPALTPPRSRV